MFYTSEYESPLGSITLASDEQNLVGLWLAGQKYYADTLKNADVQFTELPVHVAAKKWLDDYFLGKNPPLRRIPLAPQGSQFRRNVWDLLCQIPYGEFTTYGTLGKQMATLMGRQSRAGQAIGGAVGRNPVSIIIPCHRVIGTDGSLTGFAGGIDKKVKLLELEGVDVSVMTVPVKGTAL